MFDSFLFATILIIVECSLNLSFFMGNVLGPALEVRE
jgi:hypothetical protein